MILSLRGSSRDRPAAHSALAKCGAWRAPLVRRFSGGFPMMIRSRHVHMAAGTLLACSAAAFGQAYSANFESPPFTAGLVTTGQDGWYLPVTAPLSLDHTIYVYAGNTLGIPVNPFGGAQFDGGMAATTTLGAQSARAQHTIDFSSGGIWESQWDCTGQWNGTLPAIDNIGSWSMQPSATAAYFQQLMDWGSAAYTPQPPNRTTTADKFHIHIGHFTAAAPTTIVFESPGPAWTDIPVGNWVRIRVRWDFTLGQRKVLQVSIQNLTICSPPIVTDVSALNWYLQGGPNGTQPLPTDVRVFAGGSTATGSDVSGWDNLVVQPSPGPFALCYANCDGSQSAPCLNVGDFGCFLNAFAAGDCKANCDGSTNAPVLNVGDFGCFLNAFAAGCSNC
jgi:hypothetical protein